MKTSVIRQRVADFLKAHAPFDSLAETDLLELAGSGKVKFHESEEYVFQQGDAKGPFLWMIEQGRVELLEEAESGPRLRDVMGTGDLLFAGDGACQYSARTASDVILYGVATALFEAAVARYPQVRRFLSAHFSISGNFGFQRNSWLEAGAPPAEFLRARTTLLLPDTSTREAASLLLAGRCAAAIVIDHAGRPLGTLTALDLCAALDASVGEVAHPNPPTAAFPLTTRAAVRQMLQARGDVLAITADGSPSSPVEAMLTAAELALFCGRDPAYLIKAIRRAASPLELVPLLHQAVSLLREGLAQPQDVDDCCQIGSEMMAATAEACIRLAAEDVEAAGLDAARVPHCWVMFGAPARGDLLGPELPAIAAIYDDSGVDFHSTDSVWFAALAGEAAAGFHALELSGPGLDWPEGARPSMPLSEWTRLYRETIRNPTGHDLYARRSFFDLRPLSGDASILDKLEAVILSELRDHATAIPLLANDTLAHVPPLTFFRGLVLELDGGQRDSFDIGDAVIAPLANAARVLAMAKGRLRPAATLARLENAVADYPEGAGLLREAADAFRIGLYYQTLAGGARIDSATLGKFDQLLLKSAFSSIQRVIEFTVSTFVPTL